MKEEVIKELEVIKKDCLESSDPELNLIGHLLTTIIISDQRSELDFLAKTVSKWIGGIIGKNDDGDIDIHPPSLN